MTIPEKGPVYNLTDFHCILPLSCDIIGNVLVYLPEQVDWVTKKHLIQLIVQTVSFMYFAQIMLEASICEAYK